MPTWSSPSTTMCCWRFWLPCHQRAARTWTSAGKGLRARVETLLQIALFHRIPRSRERGSEVFSGDVLPVAAVLELAERRMVKRILRDAVDARDRSNLFQPT